MPKYMGKDVSDDYLQQLIAAYREGQQSVRSEVEESDQVVINRLESKEVVAPYSPSAFGLGAVQSKE